MDSDQLLKRENIWYLLSDLYLDTEFGESDAKYMASEILESGFDLKTIEKILFDEVHPVFCWNLMTVAGEWAGFKREYVAEMVSSNLRSEAPKSWFEKQKYKARLRQIDSAKYLVKDSWLMVKSYIQRND